MPADVKSTTILVPGQLHPKALNRLNSAFRLVHIGSSDPALLDEEMKSTVRGIAGNAIISAGFIDALPQLEIISHFGVGYDPVDAPHAGRKGVMVTHTPDVLTEEVADTAVGLLINTVRELPNAEAWLRNGRWASEGAYPLTRGSLRGRTVGIFGMGRIGVAIARRLEAFGLPIAYHNRNRVPDLPYAYHDTLEGLASSVDTLVSVAPGVPSTEKAVNGRILAALGANGVFVNVGRGSTVDEAALAKALADGTIMAAGLDVFANEPIVPQPLLDAPNTSLLPHVASASIHTREAMADLVADNLLAWFGEGRALTSVPETAHIRPR